MPTVAVYAYSQTGQLHDALDALLAPLEQAGVRIERVTVRPDRPYPFPWPVRRFFGIFPEAVDDEGGVTPMTLDPPEPPRADLVVLGFQVWYLAPSIPVRSLLASRSFAGQDVLGVVACRNMWYSAALEVQRRLAASGARYTGTVAAIDTAPAGVTFVTTLSWLLRGVRKPLRRLPPAGVGPDELARLGRLGALIAERLGGRGTEVPAVSGAPATDLGGLAESAEAVDGADLVSAVSAILREADAAPVEVPIAAGDLIAGRAFRVWGRAVRARRSGFARAVLLTAFVGWLLVGIVLGLPILVLASTLGRSRLAAAVRSRLAPVLAPSPVRPTAGFEAGPAQTADPISTPTRAAALERNPARTAPAEAKPAPETAPKPSLAPPTKPSTAAPHRTTAPGRR